MRVGQSYVTGGPSSATAHPAVAVRPTPFHCPNGDPEREGDGSGIPTLSLPPKFSPPQTQTQTRPSPGRRDQSDLMSRNRVRSAVPVPPRPTRREFEFPGIKVAARPAAGWERAQHPGQGRGTEGGPGRSPRARAAPGTSGSAAAVATPRLQLSRRVAGERRGESEGSGEGRGGARLSVPCAEKRRVAPRALLSAGPAPTGRLLRCWPPPRLAAGTKAHPRHAGRSSVPLGPPLAACNFRRAAGSDEAHPKRPEALHPRAPCPGPGRPAPPGSAPGRRRTRLVAEHRAAQPAPLSPEPPPPLKSAINFPSLPPPCSAPATQTPPPDAPSRAPSSPAPAGRAAPRRPPPPRCAPGSRWPLPGPAATPGSRAEPGQALRA